MRICGSDVNLSGDVRRFGHFNPFLRLIALKQLHYRAMNRLTAAEMLALLQALDVPLRSSDPVQPIYMLWVFTTDADGRTDQIDAASIHGVLLLTDSSEVSTESALAYALDYYEREAPTNEFRRIDSISCVVQGPMSFDDLRALHFARFDPTGLPEYSTIYEFRAASFANVSFAQSIDREVRFRILADEARWGGLHTIGLYGRELYTSFALPLDNDPFGGECGNTDENGCDPGPHACVTNTDVAGYTCSELTGDSGCSVVAAEVARARIPVMERVDFGAMRLVHEELFRRSAEGRTYIAAYYTISLFMKIDRASLWKYVRVLPHFNRAVRVLLCGSDDDIVVTQRLRDAVIEFVRDHREIGDPRLDRMLDVVERDIQRFMGQSRKGVLAAMGITAG